MVPFSAGGVVDAVARQWAERVKPHLGTIVIENQGGGGGTIATSEAGIARCPMANTALLANTSMHGAQPRDHGQVSRTIRPRIFAPISILAISASGIMIHPSIPAKNLQEFHRLRQGQRQQAVVWLGRHGTMTQLAGELFKIKDRRAGQLSQVPYRGAGPERHRPRRRARSRWRPSI
jgi:tripartite-type tricarboxylate transporter receptor subunit TctC